MKNHTSPSWEPAFSANPIPYRTLLENEWVFPDDLPHPETTLTTAEAARGGNLLVQLVTGRHISAGAGFSMQVNGANGVTVTPYQLLPVHVAKNSAPRGKMETTDDYESVKNFVTRRAPFDVLDITAPIGEEGLSEGVLALALRFTVSADAPAGVQEVLLLIRAGEFTLSVPVRLTVHAVRIPSLRDSRLSVCNWLFPYRLAATHGVEVFSEDYYTIYRRYLSHQLDIRSNLLCLVGGFGKPTGVTAIRDENGRVIDFDITHLERSFKIAKEMGFTLLSGPFVAHWVKWTDASLWLLWDKETEVTTPEALRQLALYFTKIGDMLRRNDWEKCYLQCLVDEPQTYSEPMYWVLSGICRRYLPGIPISDPIETTGIGGAMDIYCVKQAAYERDIDFYRELQKNQERFTFYTCGYPAGDTMNRVLDLPVSAGRLPFWMCHRYGFEGFLHWGYHVNELVGPAGNQNIVYPHGNTVAESVRSHAQRAGAEDWELLEIIRRHDPEKADALVKRACRDFNDYERDAKKLESIRHDLLMTADLYATNL